MFGLFKRKKIEIENKSELVKTMSQIVELLNDNGFICQAAAVEKPLQYLNYDDKKNFLKTFLTIDIWGGSGAAWEVGGFKSRQTEVEFQSCFIKLAELMKQTGIKSRKAESVARFFKEDVEKNNSTTYR